MINIGARVKPTVFVLLGWVRNHRRRLDSDQRIPALHTGAFGHLATPPNQDRRPLPQHTLSARKSRHFRFFGAPGKNDLPSLKEALRKVLGEEVHFTSLGFHGLRGLRTIQCRGLCLVQSSPARLPNDATDFSAGHSWASSIN